MGVISNTPRASITQADSPTIFNKSAPTANTEVSQLLSNNTKKFIIKVRSGNAKLQLAFVSTESSTNFITVPAGAVYEDDGLDFSGTVYFQTNKASQTVEIRCWV